MHLSEFTYLINHQYLNRYNTLLQGGFSEPFYVPEQPGQSAQIQFSHDYFRSALHELAHWCIAGRARRKLPDYGYWYAPDGRTQQQQNEFYRCEVKPQAIEWAFAMVCNLDFDVSVDNIHNSVSGVETFRQAVREQCRVYLQTSFPQRAEQILHLLFKTTPQKLDMLAFLHQQWGKTK